MACQLYGDASPWGPVCNPIAQPLYPSTTIAYMYNYCIHVHVLVQLIDHLGL